MDPHNDSIVEIVYAKEAGREVFPLHLKYSALEAISEEDMHLEFQIR